MNKNKGKKIFAGIALAAIVGIVLILATGCSEDVSIVESGTETDIRATQSIASELAGAQSTPTDINYSLERYNLIRRAYWVNGQREKANALVCQVEKPLGYIVLFAGNTTVGRFVVDGKVSSLNSFLSPDYIESTERHIGEAGGGNVVINAQMADVDGSYGQNDDGIFFFTPDGKYVEWTGEYLYSDIPFEIEEPVVRYGHE